VWRHWHYREGENYCVHTEQGVVSSASLVIATGAYGAKIGATAFGYKVAEPFGFEDRATTACAGAARGF
jgi:predicted flavoprotein YhiN